VDRLNITAISSLMGDMILLIYSLYSITCFVNIILQLLFIIQYNKKNYIQHKINIKTILNKHYMCTLLLRVCSDFQISIYSRTFFLVKISPSMAKTFKNTKKI
jgi:hypothetical protein